MRRIRTILFAVAAMAAVSCAKEIAPETNETPEVNPNLVEITLTATGESDEDTKAVFSGYPKIAWEGNETISLLGTNTGNQMLTANGEKGHQTTFTGYADVTDEVYYAVYPYDANVTLTDGKLSNVTVPAVQTATAGSFDPNAYIAVAKSTDKENLYFKAVGAFVKFKLEDAENVKSVTMVSNSGKNMASSATVSLGNDGSVSHGSPYVDGTASSSVKMVGDFQTDKAYFMVVRPQPYEGGVTFYIEYKDGTVLSRRGENPLFDAGKARNYIRNLNILQKKDFSPVKDLYSLYEMGYDINVGGKVYNKSTHEATLITATEASTSLYTQINKGGLYFLATSGEGSFNLHSNVAVTTDVILVGNTADKVSVDMSSYKIYHKSATLAFKNIEINATNSLNYVIANNTDKDVDAFVLDNCAVKGLAIPLWYASTPNYSCKNFTLVNTDIEVSANNTHILHLNNTTSTANESVVIENCIFYAGTNTTGRIINNSGNIVSTASLKFNNNTIFNLHSGVNAGLVHMAGASSVEFKNNLFDFWALNDVTNDGKFEYAVRIWKNSPVYNVENNHYWRRDGQTVESDKFATHGNGTNVVYATTATAAVTSGKYPFTSTVAGAGATR